MSSGTPAVSGLLAMDVTKSSSNVNLYLPILYL